MRVSGGIRSMLFGRKESQEMKQELEKFRNRVLHVRRVLSDPELTTFTLVTIPEKMGVNETVRAYNSLLEYKLPINSCLVNRVTPEFDHPFLSKRRNSELARIDELRGLLNDVEVNSMELLDQEVVGVDNLRMVAEKLYGSVKQVDESLGPHEVGELVKHQIHRGMHREFTEEFEVIRLHFPGIKRDELSLRSDEGVLFVGLNGRERSISTSVPVKASQVDAKLEEDVLRLNIPLIKE
jgi:arsenite-transporting ATPase